VAGESRIGDYAKRLRGELRDLDADDLRSAGDRQIVTLDQQSVGRLSRMDALQRQAMAAAQARLRAARRQKIHATLQRIEDHEFGYCADCGDEIAEARLDLDPTVSRCVSCASG
jgi:DnaK suppressor protein